MYSGFFPAGAKNKIAPRFERSGWTYAKACTRTKHIAKSRRSDLPYCNIKQDLARKLDPTLKPSHLKETTYLTHFHAENSKMFSRTFHGAARHEEGC